MAISLIRKPKCPKCGKPAVEVSTISFGDSTLISLECGHVVSEAAIEHESESEYLFKSKTKNYQLRPYQIEGVKFIEAANGNCLIAHEQGLGKTMMTQAFLKLHLEQTPAVIATKTTLKHQWWHEFAEWCGMEDFLVQVINSSKEKAIPGFKAYIITYDILKTEGIFDYIPSIKTLILDECQAIKNHLSGRAKAVFKIAKKCEHIIGLSGTPIKNHAGEYFTILNLIKPRMFPDHDRFVREHCDSYETQYGYKVGGLKDPEEFHEITKDFVIRRTREEVAPDLPRVNRMFHHVELDKRFNKVYAEAMKELDELLYSDDSQAITSMIAIYTKMRKITGMSKTVEAKEYIMDFLASNDRKLVVFVHHHSTHHLLSSGLDTEIGNANKEAGYELYKPTLSLSADLTADKRASVIQRFRDDDKCRILIASTLAAGEGLNLQFCSDAIMLERQWNPANEEQAEGRFARIGSTASQVNLIYFIASETIDEYFTEIVEIKRSIVSSTLDNKEIAWDSNSLMKELAHILVSKGKTRWKL